MAEKSSHCAQVLSYGNIEITSMFAESGYGFLSDSTKPLPEPLLTNTKGVLQHSPESNFTRNTHELNPNNVLEDHTFKITTTTPRGQLKKRCVSHCLQMAQVLLPS